jgi:hypothetical protein
MATAKKTKVQKNLVTVRFGYGLFALTILAVVVSTVVPLGNALTYPTARHFNILVMMISFVGVAVLPALISYLVGDRATHVKNRALHHYNGVLFGIASYWLMMVFGYFGFSSALGFAELSFPMSLVINSIVPIILTIGVMTLLAISAAKRSKSSLSVLHHPPFQVVLLTSFIAAITISLAPQYLTPENFSVLALMYVVIPASMVFFSYKFLSVLGFSKSVTLAAATIAVSVAFISASVLSQLMMGIAYSALVPIGIGLAVWIGYLVVMVRSSKSVTAL